MLWLILKLMIMVWWLNKNCWYSGRDTRLTSQHLTDPFPLLNHLKSINNRLMKKFIADKKITCKSITSSININGKPLPPSSQNMEPMGPRADMKAYPPGLYLFFAALRVLSFMTTCFVYCPTKYVLCLSFVFAMFTSDVFRCHRVFLFHK